MLLSSICNAIMLTLHSIVYIISLDFAFAISFFLSNLGIPRVQRWHVVSDRCAALRTRCSNMPGILFIPLKVMSQIKQTLKCWVS